jgi:hypothetical protein
MDLGQATQGEGRRRSITACRLRARYFQSQGQNPPRSSARPTVTFLARRAIRRGSPLAIALMLSEILAAR